MGGRLPTTKRSSTRGLDQRYIAGAGCLPHVTSRFRNPPGGLPFCSPSGHTYWYRRPAFDQTGIFAAPKVLYVTKTDTKGRQAGVFRVLVPQVLLRGG